MRFTTVNGYGFFEATSAFQKSIRRGDESVALYMMVEFFNSNYAGYLWKRMKIIASEDIGLAAPAFHATLHALHQAYIEQEKDNKENKPERMFLAHAVILMCRAKKSRLVDYALIKVWRDHDPTKFTMPDYAFDMHNSRGKAMGRGLEHFYNEGAKCENFVEQDGETKYRAEAYALQKLSPGKLKFATRKKGDIKPADLWEQTDDTDETK